MAYVKRFVYVTTAIVLPSSTNLIQEREEALTTHPCRGHVGPDVRDGHLVRAGLNDQRTQHSRFGHADVVTFLAGNREAVAFKDLDEGAIINRDEFVWLRHAPRIGTTAQSLRALAEATDG